MAAVAPNFAPGIVQIQRHSGPTHLKILIQNQLKTFKNIKIDQSFSLFTVKKTVFGHQVLPKKKTWNTVAMSSPGRDHRESRRMYLPDLRAFFLVASGQRGTRCVDRTVIAMAEFDGSSGDGDL